MKIGEATLETGFNQETDLQVGDTLIIVISLNLQSAMLQVQRGDRRANLIFVTHHPQEPSLSVSTDRLVLGSDTNPFNFVGKLLDNYWFKMRAGDAGVMFEILEVLTGAA